ncbi:putative transcriptional regulator, Crp/Fnr family [Richelia sinica FACHB-800]|uniref:Transcriptional regulator, Crp/Fnr family n=1 Tax=Richelia sinica FACHB-800 TaxID=1357546 RepID=A0A975TAM9_9NOST|nr:Crp/Fnr family transcriptional regulator [Richelia sinica]MBD2663283.1 Crp/Fnr family transcriptional regulator [Richelia sinica FACHB-800]QXE24446.1 putative transcriptional regulator, Crp/Fnr family [Richelia sinica FACHB-800]
MTYTSQIPKRNVDNELTQQLFTRREIMPFNHDVLWRIERGIVRTATWSEEGVSITLGYWGVGDVIGYPLSKINPYQIECLTSVEVSILPPQIWSQEIKALFHHIQQTEQLLSLIHRKPISLRLWQFLLWLAQKFGRNLESGQLIDLHLTHQEMAEVLNTTRVTVTRLLQKFEAEGKLLRHKRNIILRYPEDQFTIV